jgi:hypothetical protein
MRRNYQKRKRALNLKRIDEEIKKKALDEEMNKLNLINKRK